MKACRLFLAIFLLAPAVCGLSGSFNPAWEYYTVSGLNDVHVLDLDNDSVVEIYASSYDSTRPTLWVLDPDGSLSYSILIPRPGLVDYGSEKVNLMVPADLNGDGVLDILSTTEIISSGMNSHRLYRLERLFEEDLKRYRTQMDWMYTKTGLVTGVVTLQNEDGTWEVYTSSHDFNLRRFDLDGNLAGNLSLEGSVWDIHPLVFRDGTVGLAAASFKHVYATDRNLNMVWDYRSMGRFSEVYAGDVDGDGVSDVFAVSDDLLYRFTVDGSIVWSKRVTGIRTNLYSADFDRDGVDELFAGAGQSVLVMNPDGVILLELGLEDIPNYVYADDLSNDGNLSLLVSTTDGLTVFDFKPVVNETEAVLDEAMEMLVLAREYYASGNYPLALDYAANASEVFSLVGDVEHAAECDALVEKSGWAVSADLYYGEALEEFESRLYYEAMNSTLKSIELYSKLNFTENVSRAVSLNQSIFYSLYGKGNLTLAENFYSKAESYYVESRFDLAVEYARNASACYALAGDHTGVSKSDTLVKLAMEKGGKMPSTRVQTTTPAVRSTTTTTRRAATTTMFRRVATTIPKNGEYDDFLSKINYSNLVPAVLVALALAALFYRLKRR